MTDQQKVAVPTFLPGGHGFNVFVSVGTRLLEGAVFFLTLTWVLRNLGGLAFHPKVIVGAQGAISNDTSAIFNWHPLLMSLAYAVFMAEAVMAYRAPLASAISRRSSKVSHAILHTAALAAAIGALIATFKSHTLKRPTPTPNLYSPHSWLGILTFSFTSLQYLAGLLAFAFSPFGPKQKAYIAPQHRFLGQVTFVLGLATMATGIQEKTTFVQNGKKLSGPQLFTDTLKIPASLLLLLAFTGILVLYHHTPGSQQERKGPEISHEQGGLLGEDPEA